LKSLEAYLKDNFKNGIVNHDLKANIDHEGNVVFYIHPISPDGDGDSMDFEVHKNKLTLLK